MPNSFSYELVGGQPVKIIPLTVTENETTYAAEGYAFNPVTASVSNTYTASDEGKVVSGGALVAQTAHAKVTVNGTVDTTTNNSVEVAVPNPSTGTLTITENGTYDVTQYASVEVTIE